MKKCPGCEYLVPDGWSECRRCGTPIGAPARVGASKQLATPTSPAPGVIPSPKSPGRSDATSRSPTPRGSAAPSGPPPRRRGPLHLRAAEAAIDDELLSPTRRPRPVRRIKRRGPSLGSSIGVSTVLSGIVIGALVIGGLWWALFGNKNDSDPAAAAGREPFAVLPPIGFEGVSPLGDAVRASAEANLQRATWQVVAASAELGGYDVVQLSDLAAFEPSLVWLDGTTASTTVNEISVALNSPAEMALAVQAGEGNCGYVRDVGSGVQQVTVSGPEQCLASSIPPAAFSATPEGAAPEGAAPSASPRPGPLQGLDTLDVNRSSELNALLEP